MKTKNEIIMNIVIEYGWQSSEGNEELQKIYLFVGWLVVLFLPYSLYVEVILTLNLCNKNHIK